ncbi:GMC family oxidoreductase [Streptomyces shenzhenensis]
MGDLGGADVLIVGAGPVGAVVADRLVRAGLDVVCLEQGGAPGPLVPPASAPWELLGAGTSHFSPNRRGAAGDYPIDDTDSDMDVLVWNGIGGGTVLWGAQWERYLPSDFRVRSLDGVAEDWPIGFEDLAPYYDRLDLDFGAAAAPGDPAFPANGAAPYPALPIMDLGRRMAEAHNRLGRHWWPGPNVVGPVENMERARREGYPAGMRARAGETHWTRAQEAGARLVTGAHVRRILLSAPDRAEGVEWIDEHGKLRRTLADVVVLSAGGIGTPRLLLASATREHPDGLANSSGLVGRNLMLHPFTRVVGLFDEPFDGVQGYWGQLLHCLEYAETDASRGFLRGAKWNLGQGFGPVAAALYPGHREQLWGPALAEHVRGWVGRSGIWGITVDDLPDEENRIELHPQWTDRWGTPVPVVHYRTPQDAARALLYNVERATESFREAGAHTVLTTPSLRGFGWHQLGSARMGRDATRSVVGPDGRAHDVPNLLILDASTFVTGSSLNPTATVCAVALRATEALLSSASDRKVAA